MFSLSINFDAHLLQLLPPLMSGARLVVAAPGRHLDYEFMAQLIHHSRVTLLTAPASLLVQYLAAVDAAAISCGSLREVTVGGEPLPLQQVQRFYKLLPDAQLHNEYGPTEATIGATIMMCSPDMQRITIGRPHSNAHCYVVDSQLQLVPPGVPGELLLSGPGLAIGYVGRPEMTADRQVSQLVSHMPALKKTLISGGIYRMM
jgi:non-ribosomal peptide synthetase component F